MEEMSSIWAEYETKKNAKSVQLSKGTDETPFTTDFQFGQEEEMKAVQKLFAGVVAEWKKKCKLPSFGRAHAEFLHAYWIAYKRSTLVKLEPGQRRSWWTKSQVRGEQSVNESWQAPDSDSLKMNWTELTFY